MCVFDILASEAPDICVNCIVLVYGRCGSSSGTSEDIVTTDTFVFSVGETTYCREVEAIQQCEGSGGEQRCSSDGCGKTAPDQRGIISY